MWTIKNVNYSNLVAIRNSIIMNPRKKFCAAVISNTAPYFNDFLRLEFIKQLNNFFLFK